MTQPSAALARVARQFADRTSARINATDTGSIFYATVTTVAAKQAGNKVDALVQVTYRGQAATVAGYPDTYTPAIGHRVLCVITRDHQLAILHRSIGAP